MNIKAKILDLHKKANPIEEILKIRGINDVRSFMYPSEKHIKSADALSNIEQGIEILLDYMKSGLSILLIVDCDTDGYTSSAIFKQTVEEIKQINGYKFTLDYYIHDKKVHGLGKDLMDYIRNSDYDLIVLPDAGSNDVEQCEELQRLGKQILVIDHHDTTKERNPYAVIINNQISDVFEDKDMTGVGVTYRFCELLYNKVGFDENTIDKHIDLMSVGMIADSCKMSHPQSRYYTFKGLKELDSRENYNQFLKHCVAKLNLRNITMIDVAFSIAPIINSVIRLGTLEQKEILFKAMCNIEESIGGEPIYEVAYKTANSLRQKQTRTVKKSVESLDEQIEQYKLNDLEIIMCDGTDVIEKSFTGLVANAVANKYNKPTFILIDYGYGKLFGSARVPREHPMQDIKTWCNDTGLFELAEGHAQSCGLILYKDNARKVYDCIRQVKLDELKEVDIDVDAIIQEQDLSIQLVKGIGRYSYLFGGDYAEPTFYITNIKVTKDSVRLISSSKIDVLKITYKGMELIKFKSSQEEYDDIISNGEYINLNVICKFNVNEYNGNVKAQMVIDNIVNVEKTDKFITSVNVFG